MKHIEEHTFYCMKRWTLIQAVLRRFLGEKGKTEGKILFPHYVFTEKDPLFQTCSRVVDLCQLHSWNTTDFVMSRFWRYQDWATKKFGVSSLPARLLPAPKPRETYLKYQATIKKTLIEFEDQMEDSVYIFQKLEKLENLHFFSPVFLATEEKYLEAVEQGKLPSLKEVRAVWSLMEKDDAFCDALFSMRNKAEAQYVKAGEV